ncbi:autophagy protein 6, partial [Ascosphaera atra]
NEPPEADSNVQPKTTTCDLFFSSDLPGYLPWVHRRFDNGMVAFLDCLKQLCEHVDAKIARSTSSAAENTETPPREPISQRYKIDRDKIRDASIRIGLKQTDETWTRACKYTLTCCKYLLAYVSNHSIAGHKKRESTTDTSAEASRKAKGKGKAAD